MWIAYPLIEYGLQEIVNVACKMAGYNGTFSPCMHGYYLLDGWKSKSHPSHLKIRSCKGNEATLLQCEQTGYAIQPLMVNCLPPGKYRELMSVATALRPLSLVCAEITWSRGRVKATSLSACRLVFCFLGNLLYIHFHSVFN